MIKVYPSKLADSEPLERHRTDAVMTIGGWLRETVRGFEFDLAARNISVHLNDVLILPADWDTTEFGPDDTLDIYPEPKGISAGTWAALAISTALSVVTNMLFKPKLPKLASAPKQGDPLYQANASGNRARYGDVIREVAGKQKIYPDYLLPPRRYFVNEREQWLDLLLCVGKGSFQTVAGRMWIGDTPAISLGGDVSYALYEPGADLSADSRAVWWQPSSEVGSTSSGTNGLELTNTTDVVTTPEATSYVFTATEVGIPSGAGAFPTGWTSGMLVRIESHLTFNVVDGGASRDIIKGDFGELEPSTGMVIEIAGANAGQYVINSYTPYSPAAPGDPGSSASVTGSAAPSRYDFGVTPASFDVDWGSTAYTVNLTTDQTDLAGLLSTINGVLSGSGLIAQNDGAGKVQITESGSPYAGESLTVSGATVDIFGASPVIVAGTETVDPTPEQPARITLSYAGGEPVTELQTGQVAMTIGYSGLRYRLTAASASAISVERLTDTGATDTGWGGFIDRSDPAASLVLDNSTIEGDWAGPFAGCPDGETTQELEIDLMFPGGLCWINKNGGVQGHGVQVEWQYRDRDVAGAWTSVVKQYYNSTLDQIGYTEKIVLPYAMRPEVRMRRIGVRYSATVANDRVEWYGLRCRLQGPTSYAGVTVLAISVRGGERIASQTENQISIEATRILPRRSGGAWAPDSATRQIVDWYAYVAKSIGYTDADLDWDRLDHYAGVWAARGDYFDHTYSEASTVKAVLGDCLRVGYAELTMEGGLLSLARDEPRTTFEQGYSPQNMTKALTRDFEAPKPDDIDGVNVEYWDETTWTTETVECRLPGDAGRRIETITADGITDRARAWRLGMRRRCIAKFRRWTYRWSTPLDALNSRYLSYCPISDDVPGYGQSALLVGIGTYGSQILLEASEPFDWSAGGTHVVGIRRPDGTLSGPYTATRVSDYQLAIDTLDFVPDLSGTIELPHLMFGPLERWSFPTLVTDIDPDGESSVDCTGANYDARVYAYDAASPPA